jgi:hypothetical protein
MRDGKSGAMIALGYIVAEFVTQNLPSSLTTSIGSTGAGILGPAVTYLAAHFLGRGKPIAQAIKEGSAVAAIMNTVGTTVLSALPKGILGDLDQRSLLRGKQAIGSPNRTNSSGLALSVLPGNRIAMGNLEQRAIIAARQQAGMVA